MTRKAILLVAVLANVFTCCTGQAGGRNNYIATGEIVTGTSGDIWTIFQDMNNNYWFGSNTQGVYRYAGKNIIHYSTRDGLAGNRILEIKEDKAGNLYFNTSAGISKFDGRKFTTLILAADNDPKAWKLEQEDLWFKGGQKGAIRYDGNNLYSLEFPKHYLEADYYQRFPNTPISPYDIYCIYRDKNGNMWFGTGAFGVYRYDGRSLSNLYEEHLTLIEKNGGSFGIRSVLEDSEGKYWICNSKYRYNILPGELPGKGAGYVNYTREKGFDVSNDPLGGDRIYFQSIAEDSKGDLWMQTYTGGIWRYNGKKMAYYAVKEGKEEIPVVSMYQDRNGGLWLGTEMSGIFKFDGREFVRFKL